MWFPPIQRAVLAAYWRTALPAQFCLLLGRISVLTDLRGTVTLASVTSET